jgi:glycerophosphoryl diester phosphodiesterase
MGKYEMRRQIFLMVLIIIIFSIFGCSKQTEIIAHRGASYLVPENTMASVMLGWEKQADVEVDIHMSKDKRIVVIHDTTTKRTSGVDLKVSETASNRLRQLDVGTFKSEEFAGEQIPFLEDIINTIPPGRKLYVEIKSGPETLPFLKRVIFDSGRASQIVIIGFDFDAVVTSKQMMPKIPTYWLKGTEKNKQTDEWISHDPKLVQQVKDAGLDGLDVHYVGLDKTFADSVRIAGLKLYVWTVDDHVEAVRLVELGVDGITTNRPGFLKAQLLNF